MLTTSTQAPFSKKRVKTGCLNCREKHKKCDEIKPVCGLCLKRDEVCNWPPPKDKITNDSFRIVKVSKKSKENTPNLQLSLEDHLLNQSNQDYRANLPEENPEYGLLLPQNLSFSASDRPSNLIPRTYSYGLLQRLDHKPSESEKLFLQHVKDNPLSLTHLLATNPVTTSPRVQNLINVAKEESMETGGSTGAGIKQEIASSIPEFQGPKDVPSLVKINSILSDSINRSNEETKEHKMATSDPKTPLVKNTGFTGSDKPESSSPFSSDSLMAPFLNYSHLHRTFRDYMFTNVANSSTIKYKDILTTSFKNLLNSPISNFLNSSPQAKGSHETDIGSNDSSANKPKFPEGLFNLLAKDFSDGNTQMNLQSVSVTDFDKLKLYKIYIQEIAPWLDVFDNNTKQFGITIPNMAKSHMGLLNSMLALASRYLEKIDKDYSPKKTVSLYHDTLRSLIPTVNKTLNTSTIASCVILCVFEMMFASPKKWRYHLEGCGAIFKMHNINGFSDEPLERGLFWCYARMDVHSTSVGEQTTIIPSENWLPYNCNIYDLKQLFNKFGNKDDMYANYMVYLCSRVLNLISNAKENYDKEWNFLWMEINDWFKDRPLSYEPILTFNDTPFPGVLYANGAPIAANQMYHMAIILLSQNKPRLHKIIYLDHVKPPIWHAKQICGISIHNENHGCWNCALQSLWIAGQLLSSDQEHDIILSLLNKIEKATGWQMKYRVRDLQKHWNGEGMDEGDLTKDNTDITDNNDNDNDKTSGDENT